MDGKEQGLNAQATNQPRRARKTKREIRQTTKNVQAILAILIVIFAAMASPATFTLNKRLFNPAAYARLRTLWFGNLPATATTAPPALVKKWYGAGPAEDAASFDEACASGFGAALRSVGPDRLALPPLDVGGNGSHAGELALAPAVAAPFAAELERVAAAAGDIRAGEEAAADAALGLVLLLDQVARNVFRDEQRLVYTHYDRLARSVLRHVLARAPRADLHPKWRASPVYRLWFYMPLMHSEFLEDHRRYEELVGDMVAELERSGDAEAAEYARNSLNFGKKHREILEKFGRYPHRNEAMGRRMTKEEKEWLEAGGETFGTKK